MNKNITENMNTNRDMYAIKLAVLLSRPPIMSIPFTSAAPKKISGDRNTPIIANVLIFLFIAISIKGALVKIQKFIYCRLISGARIRRRLRSFGIVGELSRSKLLRELLIIERILRTVEFKPRTNLKIRLAADP